MCGCVGLTFLFRGLVRLWRYLDHHMLKSVLILTIDVLLNGLLSFIISLRFTQGSFPMLWAYLGKTDSRVALKFPPFIVDIDSIIDVYVQYVRSSVTHNVQSWCARHDLFHLVNLE